MSITVIQPGYDLTEAGLVSQKTGEVKETVTFFVERGSYVVTPEQQIQRQRAREEREHRTIERGGKRKEKFVFVDANTSFEDISPAMVTRLIYLSTYAAYKEKRTKESVRADLGNPLIKEGGHLKRKDIAGVLQLSERSAANFLKEVCPEYIQEDSGGFLYLNSRFFTRGGLKKKCFKRYQQIYTIGVRRLYEASRGKNHKQLGYVFMMIPFINIEHNILCWNPEEKDKEKVVPMTPKEFCSEIGGSYPNLSRLMNVYRSIQFDVCGRKEHFCKLICNWNDQRNAKICINPAVIYAGAENNRLEITRLYFMDKCEKEYSKHQ